MSVFGMGNPLLDVSAVVGDDFLKKYGVELNNAILAEEKHLPIYEDLKNNFEVEYIAGGACQNSMRVCQWMMQTPGTVSYVGCVGKDNTGAILEKVATEDGVKVHYMKTDEEGTGMCAVLVKDSERSLVTNLCAANKYSVDHVKSDETQALLKNASICYVSGFFLTVSPESATEVANLAEREKKTFAMNVSAPFICQVPPFFEALKALISKTDILFGNESEAVALAEAMTWETKDVGEIAVKAAQLPYDGSQTGGRRVVFTQGSESTLVATQAGIESFPVPKVDKAEIVDVNGAGDSFVGGYLAFLAKGRSLQECVDAGHYAAGQIIRVSGCRLPSTPPKM